MEQDIRWKQRFANYKKALGTLSFGMEKYIAEGLSDLEKQGVIQGFEYTHELSWKVMKDFLKEKGETDIFGSRDATRLAFNVGLISQGEVWMEMIKDRSLSSHTYNNDISEQIFDRIANQYFDLFNEFVTRMENLWNMD